MTSTRPREGRGVRHAAGGEHDRLKRAVLQPVQCWDKKWTESKNGKQLQVFKWVKSDRQVDFDDDDDDDEIEQVPVPRQAEEEVGTPASALPTLQDADDTTVSTPAQTGEEDEDDDVDILPKSGTHPLSQSFSQSDRRPSLSAHTEIASQKPTRDDKKALQGDRDGDDEEEDTDSNRPLVFTPSLETPVDTQANTPQDFESMSPAPVEVDDLKDEVQVDLVVKGLDEGQAEMEDEMEEVVVKEKEYPYPATERDEATQGVDMESKNAAVGSIAVGILSSGAKSEDSSSMEVDAPLPPSV